MFKSDIPAKLLLNTGYLLFILPWAVLAQENLNLNKKDLSKGIRLSYEGRQLSSDMRYLTLSESNGYLLGISQMMLDHKNIWMKRSSAPVNQSGVIHWFDDKHAGRLMIDVSGIRSQIHSEAILEIVTVLHTVEKQSFSITAYQSQQPPGVQINHLEKIKETNIHVK